jgi:hypothetical protein
MGRLSKTIKELRDAGGGHPKKGGTASETKAAPAKSVSTAGVDPASDSKQLEDGMAQVRISLQKTGAGFGALGAAVIGGLGYTTIHQLFPFPASVSSRYLVLALCGGGAALLGTVVFTSRYFGAQRRILISTLREDDSLGHRHGEDVIRDRIDAEHARDEEAKSLRDVELRALRLSRIARRKTGPAAKKLQEESDRLNDVVSLGLLRAAATILERRAERAFRSFLTVVALGLTMFGIAALFEVADYAKGQRDLIDLSDKCTKAEKAGATKVCEVVLPTGQASAIDKAREDKNAEQKSAQAKAEAAKTKAVASATKVLGSKATTPVQRAQACAVLVDAATELKGIPASVKAAVVSACATGKT